MFILVLIFLLKLLSALLPIILIIALVISIKKKDFVAYTKQDEDDAQTVIAAELFDELE